MIWYDIRSGGFYLTGLRRSSGLVLHIRLNNHHEWMLFNWRDWEEEEEEEEENAYLSSTSGLLCLSTSWQGKFCNYENRIDSWSERNKMKNISRRKWWTWRHIAASSVLRMHVKYKRNVVLPWNQRMDWIEKKENCDDDDEEEEDSVCIVPLLWVWISRISDRKAD